jgi:hypothetical protein
MGFDLRWPIGLMFTLLGALLMVYGAATAGDAMYERSLGYNVNLLWGMGLLLFGATLLWFLLRGRAKRRATADAGGRAVPRAGDR